MRKPMLKAALAAATPLAVAVLVPATAQAHGYISSPASRQAQCAAGTVSCGDIKYEPQSVEGAKGQQNCSAGISKFAELDDDSKGWKVQQVGNSVDFTWKNTAVHATENWQYFIDGKQVGNVDGGGQTPSTSVTHNIDLSGLSGKKKLIGVWNIADTSNAFYSCVDLQIGEGGSGTTSSTTPSTRTSSTATPPASSRG